MKNTGESFEGSQSTQEMSLSGDEMSSVDMSLSDELQATEGTATQSSDSESDSDLESTRECIEIDGGKFSRQRGLKVAFSEVEVRRYALCVGDSPAVSLGVPISIDWDCVSAEVMPIDEFEKIHSVGKSEEELAIPAEEREMMARKAGFTTEQIRDAVRAINAAKMERERTLDTLNNASQEEFMEKLRKSVWNATLRRRRKQKERALLRDWLLKDASKRVLTLPAAC